MYLTILDIHRELCEISGGDGWEKPSPLPLFGSSDAFCSLGNGAQPGCAQWGAVWILGVLAGSGKWDSAPPKAAPV